MDKRVPDLDVRLPFYADLLVQRGVNLTAGQVLILAAPVEAYAFARLVVEAAFKAGAKDVMVRWSDTPVGETRLRHAALDVLRDVPQWLADSYNNYANTDTVFLALDTVTPPPAGLDAEKLSASRIARMKATEPMSDARLKGIVRWNIASVATGVWAKMVYPDLPADAALEALWYDVLLCSRCLEGDAQAAVAAWDAHIKRNAAYRDKLNTAAYTELHFSNGLGTDLRLGLPEGYLFTATQGEDSQGLPFIPNIPSEEIFSAPHRDRVNGKVIASLPLYYNNTLIEGLWFEFAEGVVTDFGADVGREVIARLLETDEGAKRLGEVALVPYDSTVRQTGKLFYTTLYDENASCHLALGESYPDSIRGGLTLSKDELLARGMNQSLEHVDFMFGTADLEIIGTKADGGTEKVFTAGNWSI